MLGFTLSIYKTVLLKCRTSTVVDRDSFLTVQPNLCRRLLAELLGDKDQIENVDYTIAIEVWCGFTESVGDKDQIQDVNNTVSVDINGDGRINILDLTLVAR